MLWAYSKRNPRFQCIVQSIMTPYSSISIVSLHKQAGRQAHSNGTCRGTAFWDYVSLLSLQRVQSNYIYIKILGLTYVEIIISQLVLPSEPSNPFTSCRVALPSRNIVHSCGASATECSVCRHQPKRPEQFRSIAGVISSMLLLWEHVMLCCVCVYLCRKRNSTWYVSHCNAELF